MHLSFNTIIENNIRLIISSNKYDFKLLKITMSIK